MQYSDISFIFAPINTNAMEEKRYPHIEEGSNSLKACEPAASGASVASNPADGISAVHEWIDDMDWDKYPIIGPSSETEAIESIDKFENDLKNGQVHWTSSEEFDRQLFEEFPWLR